MAKSLDEIRLEVLNKLSEIRHDFYFSAKQNAIKKEDMEWSDDSKCPRFHLSIDGKEFSECVETGKALCGKWDDYVLIAKNRPYHDVVIRKI